MTNQGPSSLTPELVDLALESRPMVEDKCCHFDWCIERRGMVSDRQSEGFHEIHHGMHPGCAPYRQWLDRLDAVLNGMS